jgi:hypothetical protein
VNMNITALGADAVAKSFAIAGATIEARTTKIIHHFAPLLETYIKANASGRPGPRAITGDYRRSWNTQYGRVRGDQAAIVGTNEPQGRRLEYGFVGTDSLGRHYDQPPFPHVQPAMDRIEGPFADAMALTAGSV